MDNYKVFTFHPTHFPDPKRMVDELNKMGIHLVTIIDPGLKVEKGYFAYDEDVYKRQLYQDQNILCSR